MSLIQSLVGCSKADFNGVEASVAAFQKEGHVKVRAMLMALEGQFSGFAVDQLTHSLQMATRALRGGADAELILFSLCHDIGKAISWTNHGAIAAEILKPYVSERVYWLTVTHQDFQGRFYYQHRDKDPNTYLKYRDHKYFELGLQLSEWDAASFDPAYDHLPLSYFIPLLDSAFGGNAGELRLPELQLSGH